MGVPELVLPVVAAAAAQGWLPAAGALRADLLGLWVPETRVTSCDLLILVE
jgi:hypothetical protein